MSRELPPKLSSIVKGKEKEKKGTRPASLKNLP
jgi:hypothetical protein